MGYTHYFNHSAIDPEAFAALTSDVQRIIDAANVPLAGWAGTGEPEIGPERISFNGVADDDDYETFVITPGRSEFSFCKTERRPYDLVVMTVLLRAVSTVHEFQINSDGKWESDWEPARDLYAKVFCESADERPFV